MSKILKNTTGSAIMVVDTGITIPASPGQYTIPPADYDLWAASSDVIVYVGDASIVVNDGSTDLNPSDGMDLIKGIFPTTVTVDSITDPVTIDDSDPVDIEGTVGIDPANNAVTVDNTDAEAVPVKLDEASQAAELVTNAKIYCILEKIVRELRIQNMHLSLITEMENSGIEDVNGGSTL